jgi:hypothetical protein
MRLPGRRRVIKPDSDYHFSSHASKRSGQVCEQRPKSGVSPASSRGIKRRGMVPVVDPVDPHSGVPLCTAITQTLGVKYPY